MFTDDTSSDNHSPRIYMLALDRNFHMPRKRVCIHWEGEEWGKRGSTQTEENP